MSVFRVAYGERFRVSKDNFEPTLTKQSFQDECDINNILKRFAKTGLINHVNKYSGNYGDFTGYDDYQSCMNRVLAANEMFMALPSEIRTRFSNEPGLFVDFVTNPANQEECIKLGLATRRPDASADQSAGEASGATGGDASVLTQK